MDRICPFLALAADGRSVADGYDPDHRCHAVVPAADLRRAQQTQLCLTESHRACERYLAAMRASDPAGADYVSTRFILEAGAGWRAAARRGRIGTRRAAGPLALVAVLGLSVGTAAAIGGVSSLGRPGVPTPSPSATATPLVVIPSAASLVPSPTATPTVQSTPSPTVAATPIATPAPTPPPATPVPTPARTYTVKPGDTLSLIAQRFGTTVAAIQAANGLASADVINIGQVLVIP